MSSVLSDFREPAVLDPTADKRYNITRLVCWGLCVVLALLDAWAGRQYTDPDGISYLDMSDALLKHNWHLLINPHWSPLYPFLVGIATWLIHPSAFWELPVVHLVNFGIFLGALASFEFLMREVLQVLRGAVGQQDLPRTYPASAWRWQLLGYCLFASSTFVLISGVRRVNPDLCVAAFVYLDAGLLLRLRTGANKSRTCLLLGLTLGLGYLAKAILFPMAFVFMAVAWFVIGEWRRAVLPLAITLLVFSAIAAPPAALISRMVGRLSFSESGMLNVAWQINDQPMLPFYLDSAPPALKHPMEILYKHPNIFSFAGPAPSTYSPWHDPWYWNAGADTAFSLPNQVRAIGRNLAALFADWYMAPIWALIGGCIVLFFMSRKAPRRLQSVTSSWPLLIPAIAAISFYVLVLIQPRYIAPFLVLLFLGIFPYILVQKSSHPSKSSAVATSIIATAIFGFSALLVVSHLIRPMPSLRGNGGEHYRAAEFLNGNRVLPGQSVGLIGSGWDVMIWARLARVQIVAQIPPGDANLFWQASAPRVKMRVYDAFAGAGAKAVITAEIPPSSGFGDWQQVGDTHYYVHFLTPPQS